MGFIVGKENVKGSTTQELIRYMYAEKWDPELADAERAHLLDFSSEQWNHFKNYVQMHYKSKYRLTSKNKNEV